MCAIFPPQLFPALPLAPLHTNTVAAGATTNRPPLDHFKLDDWNPTVSGSKAERDTLTENLHTWEVLRAGVLTGYNKGVLVTQK